MNHFISLDQAIQMTTTYRENRNTILAPNYQGADYLPNAETFDRAAFDTILAKPSCASLRIYYSMDNELKVHAIIVGVDADGQDILPNAAIITTEEGSPLLSETGESLSAESDEEEIIEMGQRCPPYCTISPLNP